MRRRNPIQRISVVFQPRPEAKPEDEDFVSDEGGPAVLNPKAPLEMTKKFMRRHCIAGDGWTTLRCWQGQYYSWNGVFYETVELDGRPGPRVYLGMRLRDRE